MSEKVKLMDSVCPFRKLSDCNNLLGGVYCVAIKTRGMEGGCPFYRSVYDTDAGDMLEFHIKPAKEFLRSIEL